MYEYTKLIKENVTQYPKLEKKIVYATKISAHPISSNQPFMNIKAMTLWNIYYYNKYLQYCNLFAISILDFQVRYFIT